MWWSGNSRFINLSTKEKQLYLSRSEDKFLSWRAAQMGAKVQFSLNLILRCMNFHLQLIRVVTPRWDLERLKWSLAIVNSDSVDCDNLNW